MTCPPSNNTTKYGQFPYSGKRILDNFLNTIIQRARELNLKYLGRQSLCT